MENRGFWRLEGVSDAGLQRELMQLLANGHRTEARIVAHIAEVERRKLFLKEGFSALYKYCQQRLGLSEYESWHRMTAARLGRRFPLVFDLLDQRKIHLSGLCALRHFLTPDNHRQLLQEACGKTKQQVEQLLATRFPASKLPDSMRRLPAQRIVASVAVPARSSDSPVLALLRDSRKSSSQDSERNAAPLFAEHTDVVDPTTGEVTTVLADPGASASGTGSATSAERAASAPLEAAPVRGATLAAAQPRYRVQFDASSALKAKIELAQALSSHANPNGDLEMLFERALDLYLEHLQKKRFGKTDRPRNAAKPTSEEGGEERKLGAREVAVHSKPNVPAPAKRPHIPHETRRKVSERDGLRCAYVSPTGQRCEEQSFLQIHHHDAWARSKNDQPGNLRIYCAGHNRFQAEHDFGDEHVARRIQEARARRSPVNTPQRSGRPSNDPPPHEA